MRDLFGLQPFAGPDTRRWLDHGRWGVRQPLGRNDSAPATGDAYAFLQIRDVREPAPRFSGGMFASSPALSALDHPRYDVWVVSCSNS